MVKPPFLSLNDQRRKELIDKAKAMYIEVPYEKITVNSLISALSINPATFYRYFDDKDDLYCYIYDEIDNKFLDAYKNSRPETAEVFFYPNTDISDKVSPEDMAFMETIDKAPRRILMNIFFGKYKDRWFEHGKAALRKLRYDGELRPNVDDDLIAYTYASLYFNMLMYFREFHIDDPDIQAKIRRNYFMDFFLHGILNHE